MTTTDVQPADGYDKLIDSALDTAARYESEREKLFFDEKRINMATAEVYTKRRPLLADTAAHDAKMQEIDDAVKARLDETLQILESEIAQIDQSIANLSYYDYFQDLSKQDLERAQSLSFLIKEDVAGKPAALVNKIRAAQVANDKLRLALYVRYIQQAMDAKTIKLDAVVLATLREIDNFSNPNAEKIKVLENKRTKAIQTVQRINTIRTNAVRSLHSRIWKP
jgi:hypothetical protein